MGTFIYLFILFWAFNSFSVEPELWYRVKSSFQKTSQAGQKFETNRTKTIITFPNPDLWNFPSFNLNHAFFDEVISGAQV